MANFGQLIQAFITLIEANILDNTTQLIIPSKHRQVLYSVSDLLNYFDDWIPIIPANYKLNYNENLNNLKAGYVTPYGTLVDGDTILLTAQTDPSTNGVWRVNTHPYLPERPSYFETPWDDDTGKLVIILKIPYTSGILYRIEIDGGGDITCIPIGPIGISDLITDPTVISNITDEDNWDDDGDYTGPLTGLVQDNYYIDYLKGVHYKYDGTHLIRYHVNNVF